MTSQRRKTDSAFAALDQTKPALALDIDLTESSDLIELRYQALRKQHIASLNYAISQSKIIDALKTENERLYKLAYFDKLTGLPNQRLLEDSFEQAATNGDKIVLVFIDLNKFKKINDTYGHAIGDEALKLASKTLLSMTRQNDIVAHIDEVTLIEENQTKHLPVRYAGDEFVILFIGTTSSELSNKVSQIKNAFAQLRLKLGPEHGNIEIPVGASIGAYERQEGDTLDTCKKNADAAMYADKSAGNTQNKLDFSSFARGYEYPKAVTFTPNLNVYQFPIPVPK
jgi:GGDEF domain-containing protein